MSQPESLTDREKWQKVLCQCCGTEVLAILHDEKVIIKDRRHGSQHFVVLDLRLLRLEAS